MMMSAENQSRMKAISAVLEDAYMHLPLEDEYSDEERVNLYQIYSACGTKMKEVPGAYSPKFGWVLPDGTTTHTFTTVTMLWAREGDK